jgi:hypothetical protein
MSSDLELHALAAVRKRQPKALATLIDLGVDPLALRHQVLIYDFKRDAEHFLGASSIAAQALQDSECLAVALPPSLSALPLATPAPATQSGLTIRAGQHVTLADLALELDQAESLQLLLDRLEVAPGSPGAEQLIELGSRLLESGVEVRPKSLTYMALVHVLAKAPDLESFLLAAAPARLQHRELRLAGANISIYNDLEETWVNALPLPGALALAYEGEEFADGFAPEALRRRALERVLAIPSYRDLLYDDADNGTFLHVCAWKGWSCAFRLGIEAGADPSITDDNVETAADIAKRRGHAEICATSRAALARRAAVSALNEIGIDSDLVATSR